MLRSLSLIAAGTMLTFAVTNLLYHYLHLSVSYGRLILF